MLAEVLSAAAAAGGTAVVESAGSDFWAWFKTRGARLIGRGDVERESEALDRLERTAAALAAASDEEERERVRAAHARLWQGEFASLLEILGQEERERAVAELNALAREFGTAGEKAEPVVSGNTFLGPANVQIGDNNRQENNFGSAG